MNTLSAPLCRLTATLLLGGAIAAVSPAAFGGDEADAVAISSKVSTDYVRPSDDKGAPLPESYVFAKGGLWRSADAGTKDDLDFMQVAHAVAGPLAGQNYLSSRDPKTTKLMIMVYWGTTRVPDHAANSIATQNLQAASQAALAANHAEIVRFNPNDSCAPQQMAQSTTVGYTIRTPEQISTDAAMTGAMAMEATEDNQRTQLDKQNAMMLGYDSWWAETAQFKDSPLEIRRQDMLSELESHRYFVVLMAYDFQMLWKDKKPKLLWETRFSINDADDDFAKHLTAMINSAAPYFGKDSGKLLHKPLPEGHVEVGPIKNLAFADSK